MKKKTKIKVKKDLIRGIGEYRRLNEIQESWKI